MIEGFSGETVRLFVPSFRDHMLTAVIDGSSFIGKIEDKGRTEFEFGGKNLREVLDLSDQFYLVKLAVKVPAFEPINGDELAPLDLMDDYSA